MDGQSSPRDKAITLLVMGRGGTGKTSFVALAAKHFIAAGKTPLLLVDLDPDQNLGEMVGVDLESEGVKTISELVTDTFIGRGGTLGGIAPSERIENRIWGEGLYESDFFDLVAIGTRWVEGCYCLPDAALKVALTSITKNYRFVLIDSPAGLEHLNRKITSHVDAIIDIVGPSGRTFGHVRRSRQIIREVNISTGHFYIVGGFLYPAPEEQWIKETFPGNYLGKVAADPAVQEYVLSGRSLLEIHPDSPGYRSIQEILERTGFDSDSGDPVSS
jgi:CO dehydrogenase maturation factor